MSKDYIGSLVKQYESGSKGSLALGTCGYDWGLSCGSYQLTLRWSNCIGFLKKYFKTESKALYFNSKMGDLESKTYPGADYCSSPDEVKKVWKACYDKVGADKFFEYEHEHIQNNYYEQALKLLKKVFNPNTHSRMAQECIWSWAVHKGSSGCYKAFMEVCEGKDPQNMPADELIDLLYDKRYKVNKCNRYKTGLSEGYSEREKLRKYCNEYPLPYKGTNGSDGKTATGIKKVANPTPVVVKPAEPVAEPKKDDNAAKKTTLYRVQVGAYRVKANAVKTLSEVKKAGFTDAFISYSDVDKYYRVQVGAFSVFANAKAYTTKLKSRGFDTYIATVNK